MRTLTIPPELADAVGEDDIAERFEWLAALPRVAWIPAWPARAAE